LPLRKINWEYSKEDFIIESNKIKSTKIIPHGFYMMEIKLKSIENQSHFKLIIDLNKNAEQISCPVKANEIVALDGAQIPFTSTDQKGNFDIGEGLRIDQTTSTISGRSFSRAIQAEITPLILALR
jgi:hypothetical protein